MFGLRVATHPTVNTAKLKEESGPVLEMQISCSFDRLVSFLIATRMPPQILSHGNRLALLVSLVENRARTTLYNPVAMICLNRTEGLTKAGRPFHFQFLHRLR